MSPSVSDIIRSDGKKMHWWIYLQRYPAGETTMSSVSPAEQLDEPNMAEKMYRIACGPLRDSGKMVV
jgi:hypothetical protein